MPTYNGLSKIIRVNLKRAVKTWLLQKLGNQSNQCVIYSTKNGKSHHTYGVPKAVLEDFVAWAKEALVGEGIAI